MAFQAGQKVKVKEVDTLNPYFWNREGYVGFTRPFQFDYYFEFENDRGDKDQLAVNESEIEHV